MCSVRVIEGYTELVERGSVLFFLQLCVTSLYCAMGALK